MHATIRHNGTIQLQITVNLLNKLIFVFQTG